jgi:hypothetical protein
LNFSHIKEIEEKKYNLIEPQRFYIHEGKLLCIKAKNGVAEERYVYLFNDILLICKIPDEDKNGLIYDCEVKLKRVQKR